MEELNIDSARRVPIAECTMFPSFDSFQRLESVPGRRGDPDSTRLAPEFKSRERHYD